jgi:hypothetical protein
MRSPRHWGEAASTSRPAAGDVRAWQRVTRPAANGPRGDFVTLAPSLPDGNALFEASRNVLLPFLPCAALTRLQRRPTWTPDDHLDVDLP